MASSADASATMTCGITNIRVVNLPGQPHLWPSKAYVQIEATGPPWYTEEKTWKNGGEVRWEETTKLQVLSASESITFSLMQKRTTLLGIKASKILEGSLKIKLPDLLERCDGVPNKDIDLPLSLDGKETCKLRMQITMNIPNAPSSSTAAPSSSISAPFSSTSASLSSATVMPSSGSTFSAPGPTAAELSSVMDSLPKIATSLSTSGPVTTGADALSATGDAVASVAHSDLVASLETVVGKLDILVNIGDQIAKIHPWASLAWNVLSIGLKVVLPPSDCDTSSDFPSQLVKDNRDRNNKIVGLIQTLQSTYAIVDGAEVVKDDRLQDVLGRILQQTLDCAYFIQHYARSRSSLTYDFTIGKAITEPFSDTDARVAQYQQKLGQFQLEFHGRIAVKTALLTVGISATVDAIRLHQHLDKLGRVEMPQIGDPCLPGTRVGAINMITKWHSDDSSDRKNVMWLHGMAGAGKSTLSTTIANMMGRADGLDLLGAFFVFDRSVAERKPSTLIRTIAYQLAEFDAVIGARIQQVIEKIPRIAEESLKTQFSKLLSSEALGDIPWSRGPILIIIDALDESGTATERERLLKVLSEGNSKLPHFIRLLIVSRPERDIADHLTNDIVRREELRVDPETGGADVAAFIRSRLKEVRDRNVIHFPDALKSWPDDDDINGLVNLASGHFIWAHTACRMIGTSGNPKDNLEDLIKHLNTSDDSFTSLYQLYKTALNSAIRWDNRRSCEQARDLLGAVICAQVPLSCDAIDELLGQRSSSSQTVSSLGSVLSRSETGPIRIVHTSFYEYLTLHSTTELTAEPWALTVSECHAKLAERCIELLAGKLKENMCDLVLPHPITDQTIPETTTYAANFWIEHVCLNTKPSEDFANKIHQFMRNHLLHWMEALSILKAFDVALRSLATLLKWIQVRFRSTLLCSLLMRSVQTHVRKKDLFDFVQDAHHFARYYEHTIIKHPLLIYMSALPFTPHNTIMYKTFFRERFPRVVAGIESEWPLLLQILRGHGDAVHCVSFSRDGSSIVSGSADGTVQVWDALSGQPALPPLQGHISAVWSVCFSPDGSSIVLGSRDTVRMWNDLSGRPTLLPLQRHKAVALSVCFSTDGSKIVSGWSDGTVRVWDVLSGQPALPPLQGHISAVWSVCFSPDGSRIVSGSRDKTVRVWDVLSGQPALPPLLGHDDLVRSVCFSPDGSRIVSGSHDKTVRVWDALSEQLVLPPLRGHEGHVTSVCFSPDGFWIVSGSKDKTVRVWDVLSGQPAMPPLQGHEDIVNSVCFSPDGSRIVSGSSDKTMRVWDALSRQSALPPLQGHEGPVTSVCFSPDGSMFVSWSDDNNIQVWDALSGQLALPPLRGHEGPVTSVCFSPDGSRIVSGSHDKTMRVWDALSRQPALPPLQGHKARVSSVCFSPDGSKIVSGSDDKTVRVWHALNREPALPPLQGHEGQVASVCFSSDGSRIVSGSYDKTVRVWDALSGQPTLLPLQGHEAPVVSVCFSPDGSRIVSRSWDDTTCVWDASTGHPIEDQTTYVEPPAGVTDHNGRNLVRLEKNDYICHVSSGRYLAMIPPGFSFSSSRYTHIDMYCHQSCCVLIRRMSDKSHVPLIIHFPT
ncbi:hypothetical protein HWV62_37809 [Athelia sp. TMB]|nr:hypothetical protein HWV62_37809 [Athelia sp. TMB]